MRSICLGLFIIVLCALSGALAQSAEGFFPYHVGDRWLYEVEGTTGHADTVDAVIEWTILEVKTSEEADSISVAVSRQNLDGSTWEGTCGLRRTWGGNRYDFLQLIESSDYELCSVRGGLPFGDYRSYPFLNGPDALGTEIVEVGGSAYTVKAASADFYYSTECCGRPPPDHQYHTGVRALLADGIGIVEMRYTFEEDYRYSTPVRRDTLRTRLVGAQVGGNLYGDIQPVASEPGPRGPSFSIRVGPNPARGRAVVWVSGVEPGVPVRIWLFDAYGRVVREVTVGVQRQVTVSLDGLAAGLYHARVEADGEVAQTRVVVMR